MTKFIDYTLTVRNNGEIVLDLDGQECQRNQFDESQLIHINECLELIKEKKYNKRKNFTYFGNLLYKTLIKPVESRFTVSWKEDVVNAKEEVYLRLKIVFEEFDSPTDLVSQIINLPWEFLCYGDDNDRFLGTDSRVAISYHHQNWLNNPLDDSPIEEETLRVLLVHAHPEQLPVGFEKQISKKIVKLTEKVELINLENPTREELKDAIKQKPHVLHFLGHGQPSELALRNDETGEALWFPDRSLSDLICSSRIKLVVLQACESAASPAEFSFSGTAAQVVKSHIPAVVAFRYPIEQPLAWKFIKTFYTHVSEGKPLDIAVQAGREALANNGHSSRDFGSPVLWMRYRKGILVTSQNSAFWESQQPTVNSPLISYKNWRLEQNKHFSNALKSEEKSRCLFHQSINVEDENVKFIERRTLTKELDIWYSNWGKEKKIFTVLGEEGDGKTWGVARWLGQKIQQYDTFPAIVFLSSIQANINDPLNLLSEVIARSNFNVLTKEEIKSSVERWLDKPNGDTPILLLVLDGINERHNFQWWGQLLDVLVSSPWQNNVAILTTCRKGYWSLHYRSLHFSKTNAYELPPYSENELQEALQRNGLNRSEISDNLFPLICKPRYFDLVTKYRKRIADSGDITVARLIYEDWRDRLQRKRSINLDDNDFQGLIKNLAGKTLEKQSRRLEKIEIEENIPFIAEKQEIFEELRTGGILIKKGTKNKVKEEFLAYGFGLLLVEELDEASEQGENNLEEEISQWLEPHAEMDIKGEICHYASLIALEDIEISHNVKVALLLAWVNSHNPGENIDNKVIAYLYLAPDAYTELAEKVWSETRDNPWAQELLMYAFLHRQKNENILNKLAPKLEEWLGLVHLDGFSIQRPPDPNLEKLRQKIRARAGQQFYGFSIQPCPDPNLEKLRQKICARAGQAGQQLQPGEFEFHGYRLKAITDDGLMRLGRVALGLISYLPRKQFIRAIAIGCLAEAIMDYPDKYNLFQLILSTAADSVWDEIKSEAEKLIASDTLVTKQAAYRLLSWEGSQQAYELQQTLPKDLFPFLILKEHHQQDLCTSSIQWSQDECEICLQRSDLSVHLIAEQLKPLCINPDLKVPDNLGTRLESLVKEINTNSLWSNVGQNSEDIKFEKYEPALCAYAPNAIADLVRATIQNSTSRSGTSLRQLSFHIWEHYPILNKTEKKAIYQAWQKFNRRYNSEEELEKIAESHLFRVVLEQLEPEEQLTDLLQRPETALDLLSFEHSFKPIINSEEALSQLDQVNNKESLERILWFLGTHRKNLDQYEICQHIYPILDSSENSSTRSLVLKILYESSDEIIINKFIDSSWQWNCEHYDSENHWGSLLLCKYGQNLSYESLKNRIHLSYLGFAIPYRDLNLKEVQQYAEDLDLILSDIEQNLPELPTDFPFIEVRIREDDDLSNLTPIQLSDLYLKHSQAFVSQNSIWGGLNKNKSQEQLTVNDDKDNITKQRSKIVKETLQEQLTAGNYYFCRPIPKDVLEKVITQRPDLVDKWLKSILSEQDNIARKLINLATTFSEILCYVLLRQNHPQAIELYRYLDQAEKKVIILDYDTNIRFLDYALFQIEPNESIKKEWKERLEKSQSDLELMELAIAAQNGKGENWLQSYAEQRLQSSAPLDFSYAVTILGFLENNWAFDRLSEVAQKQPDTWRKQRVNLSLERWQKNSWAKHWFTNFISETERVTAWRCFRLFLQCVDRRFWLWQKDVLNETSSPITYLSFLEDNKETIRNSIRKNEKQLEKHFLGHKIPVPQHQVWPWIKFSDI